MATTLATENLTDLKRQHSDALANDASDSDIEDIEARIRAATRAQDRAAEKAKRQREKEEAEFQRRMVEKERNDYAAFVNQANRAKEIAAKVESTFVELERLRDQFIAAMPDLSEAASRWMKPDGHLNNVIGSEATNFCINLRAALHESGMASAHIRRDQNYTAFGVLAGERLDTAINIVKRQRVDEGRQ